METTQVRTELEDKAGITLQWENEKPVYAGDLDLRGTGITSLPDGLTVGGDLDLRGTSIMNTAHVNRKMLDFIEWKNGEYIKADGLFSKVLSRKGKVRIIQQIGKNNTAWLVTDGNGKWAHGDTLEQAKNDLVYKLSHVGKSAYASYTLDTEVTFEQGIEMYRAITGACAFGTKHFVETHLPVKKEKYTVSEIIALTKGQFGSETFSQFFKA